MTVNQTIYNMNPTHCSCCGRPRTDATSVEQGIGPICRGKYGYEDAPDITDAMASEIVEALQEMKDAQVADAAAQAVVENDCRAAAKVLNIALAIWRKQGGNTDDMLVALKALRLMTFEKLATQVGTKVAKVVVEVDKERVHFKTPYDETYTGRIRRIKGAQFDKKSKRWSVPVDGKRPAWEAMQACYGGLLGVGPKGMFTIG